MPGDAGLGAVGRGRRLADHGADEELARGHGDEADPEVAGVGRALQVVTEEHLRPLGSRVAARHR
jgi:hypothetical protein